MKLSPYKPRVHFYVCVNRRPASDPLGEGCGERGEKVFAELKARPLSEREGAWVTRTQCLGLCPKRGCTVAVAPSMQYLVDVEPDDVEALITAAR